MATPTRILLKLRPGAALGLGAAASRANLRPLFVFAPAPGLGVVAGEQPAWYVAELAEGGEAPWDAAHVRLADQLGLAATDIVYAEPDLVQRFPSAQELPAGAQPFAAQADCTEAAQTAKGGRIQGPDRFGWHLEDAYTGLASARAAVVFSAPRTRIAHIDTGYDHAHASKPPHLLTELERSFVDADGNPKSAQDPNRGWLLDFSGHGTGTIGILAGGAVAGMPGVLLGGAPEAEVLPLRVSNSVLHFWTSSFAEALQYAIAQGCDVVSASLGGLPSRAWNDAVNAAYEAGVVIVAASGDCLHGGIPTHHVVYPARYHRTIAACGAMADGRPYYHLTTGIEGSWGPKSSMRQALSAYTPNIPWAKLGCPTAIDRDGEGTSASTPQIAATAALWIEKHKTSLPRDWRRVEAVRDALFRSARPPAAGLADYLGHGIVNAPAALALAPRLDLPKTPPDHDFFAFLRVMTGLGVTEEASPRAAMFDLELTQRWLANPKVAATVDDPDGAVSDDERRAFVEAVIADPNASLALRRQLAQRWPLVSKTTIQVPASVVAPARPAFEPCKTGALAGAEKPRDPAVRRLRAYAVDPSFSTRLDSASINEAVVQVRWEKLKKGPVGEYLEVVDQDPTGTIYPPVDLDDPRLLACDGLAPAEGSPGFHQQMVYAVAMSTIEHFERALGRPVLWSPKVRPDKPHHDGDFVRRLQIRPHALRQANAFYSPQEVALLFGYFAAGSDDPGEHVPGSAVYACLSHDIVAHETTHAILDGMHRRFHEPTNPDVLAFHEAFADIVALMQHFTLPEILEREIARTGGRLEDESILGGLAIQFGRAIGNRGALRNGIGYHDDKGRWQRHKADPGAYQRITGPHARGALLVAAVFDSFLAIYKSRTADLLRLATGGSGILPAGAIHPDLVQRLAAEAVTSASHVLNLSIRALDYLPPVDLTFGEFLRGLVTADFDLVPNDRYGYRVAFVEAFRQRGIYPRGLSTLSVDTVRWEGLELPKSRRQYGPLLSSLKRYAERCRYIPSRERLFGVTRERRRALHALLKKAFAADPSFARQLGLDPARSFEVYQLRSAARTRPNGRELPQVMVSLTQEREIDVPGATSKQYFRGGSTLVVDLATPAIQYAIVKHVVSAEREERTKQYLTEAFADPLRALLMAPVGGEPFAALHLLSGDR